jgi:hypothetical protein
MFRLFAALLVCGAFLVTVPTVLADQPAAVQNDRECIPLGLDTSYCTSMKLVQHTATQPDGDQSIVYHADMTEEMTGPTGVLFSSSQSEDIHFVTMDGLLQELHDRSFTSISLPGFTCEFGTFYHYANGQVQIDRIVENC